MRLEGKRLRRTRLIQKGRYVVAVDVEMVVPPEDPSEACYESETIEFLRQVERRAARGDLAWLRKVGVVFQLVGS